MMAVIVRPTRHHSVDVFQRRGLNVNEHFPLTRFWIRKILKSGRFAKRMQDGGFHNVITYSGLARRRQLVKFAAPADRPDREPINPTDEKQLQRETNEEINRPPPRVRQNQLV